jgi:NAD(P)H-hydrate epimerase
MTIEAGTPSIDLMERAGERIAAFLGSHCEQLSPSSHPGHGPRSLLILAGPGNNGGDGFVVARLLAAQGWDVTVALCAGEPRTGSDPHTNLKRWRERDGAVISDTACLAMLRDDDAGGHEIALDALFGTGLDRDLDGLFFELVAALNESGLPIVSVDTPSGLCANSGEPLGLAVLADATVTLGAAKPGLFVGNGPNHAGRIDIADIGLREAAEAGIDPVGQVLDDETCEAWVPHRHPLTHKGDLGHVLVAGASAGKTGAVLLAARAALRAGAGLVTMAVPSSLAAATDAALAEAMTVGLADDGSGHIATGAWQSSDLQPERFDTAVIGPGMATGEGAVDLVRAFVAGFDGPLVVDADALNTLAGERGEPLRKRLTARRAAGHGAVIMTPHPGEMGRLLGISSSAVQKNRLSACRTLAEQYRVTAVLKGAASLVCEGTRTGFNSSGNAGMASAGMGDVLSGLTATLAAQLDDSYEAAALAATRFPRRSPCCAWRCREHGSRCHPASRHQPRPRRHRGAGPAAHRRSSRRHGRGPGRCPRRRQDLLRARHGGRARRRSDRGREPDVRLSGRLRGRGRRHRHAGECAPPRRPLPARRLTRGCRRRGLRGYRPV